MFIFFILLWIKFAFSKNKNKKRSFSKEKIKKANYKLNDKLLRNVLIFGILIISISIGYYLLVKPLAKNYALNKCLKNSQDYFNQKQNEISSHLENLNKEKEIIQKEVDEKIESFYQNNAEPRIEDYPIKDKKSEGIFEATMIKMGLSEEYLEKKNDYENKRNKIREPLMKIENNIKLIKNNYNKLDKEKDEMENHCYKRYK
jgi:uncharacterized membrane-anchored protein YhcB (DUF1043 family)